MIRPYLHLSELQYVEAERLTILSQLALEVAEEESAEVTKLLNEWPDTIAA